MNPHIFPAWTAPRAQAMFWVKWASRWVPSLDRKQRNPYGYWSLTGTWNSEMSDQRVSVMSADPPPGDVGVLVEGGVECPGGVLGPLEDEVPGGAGGERHP